MNSPAAPKTRVPDALSPMSVPAFAKFVAAELRSRFPAALARDPEAFRKRVLRLVDQALSLDGRAPGRPRDAGIDAGHALYQQQRREMAMRTRRRLNWPAIASVVCPEIGRAHV